ncbi:MAG: hypothetical protein AAGH41_07265 [Pseudomonadota bacterium]
MRYLLLPILVSFILGVANARTFSFELQTSVGSIQENTFLGTDSEGLPQWQSLFVETTDLYEYNTFNVGDEVVASLSYITKVDETLTSSDGLRRGYWDAIVEMEVRVGDFSVTEFFYETANVIWVGEWRRRYHFQEFSHGSEDMYGNIGTLGLNFSVDDNTVLSDLDLVGPSHPIFTDVASYLLMSLRIQMPSSDSLYISMADRDVNNPVSWTVTDTSPVPLPAGAFLFALPLLSAFVRSRRG